MFRTEATYERDSPDDAKTNLDTGRELGQGEKPIRGKGGQGKKTTIWRKM